VPAPSAHPRTPCALNNRLPAAALLQTPARSDGDQHSSVSTEPYARWTSTSSLLHSPSGPLFGRHPPERPSPPDVSVSRHCPLNVPHASPRGRSTLKARSLDDLAIAQAAIEADGA